MTCQIDSRGIDRKTPLHFGESAEDVMLAGTAILGDAATEGAEDDHAVFFGGLF
jgi:hypothetical protein